MWQPGLYGCRKCDAYVHCPRGFHLDADHIDEHMRGKSQFHMTLAYLRMPQADSQIPAGATIRHGSCDCGLIVAYDEDEDGST